MFIGFKIYPIESILPGYEDISEHKRYINKKGERCYCDI